MNYLPALVGIDVIDKTGGGEEMWDNRTRRLGKAVLCMVCACLLLGGCTAAVRIGSGSAPTDGGTTASEPTFQVTVLTDRDGELQVPDPQTADGEVELVLRDPDFLASADEGEDDEEEDALPLVDLPFTGILEKMKVTAFSVGSLASLDAAFAHVRYAVSEEGGQEAAIKGARDRDVAGNCLVLSASTMLRTEDGGGSRHYIIVLDYANRKCHVAETSLMGTWSHGTKLALTDLTGDGLGDIVVSNVLNGYRSGTGCEIFRLGTDGLRKIYGNVGQGREDACFTGHLADRYQAVVECGEAGFAQRVSLLDAGYEKSDLELGDAPPDGVEDEMRHCRGYRNGRLQQGGPPVDVYAAALSDGGGLQIFAGENMKSGIRLIYPVYMGHWNFIGDAYAYMQYDPGKDAMVVAGASFVPGSRGGD